MLRFLILLVMSLPVAAEPLVIAHRGASGYYPEHTIVAYQAAIDMGADFIEPDLVVTSDGYFVARHDIFLGSTTNVAEVFPDRRRQGESGRDWFVSDFTLAEIHQLRARQAFAGRTDEFDDRFGIPTLQEIIALVHRVRKETGREVGLYPELKSPATFHALGFDTGSMLISALARHAISVPVLIQSFDEQALRRLSVSSPYPLVMLLYPSRGEAGAGPNVPLAEVAEFAAVAGLSKSLLLDSEGRDTGLVRKAHSLGLKVHAWTFRDDKLPDGMASGEAEIQRYLSLGVDGIFTDFPDTGIRARNAWRAGSVVR